VGFARGFSLRPAKRRPLKDVFVSMTFLFRQLEDKLTQSRSFTYILGDLESNEAIIIDSVFENVDRDIKLINEMGLHIVSACETHIHADHLSGVSEIAYKASYSLRKIVYGISSGAHADVIDNLQLVKSGDRIHFGAKFFFGGTRNTRTQLW